MGLQYDRTCSPCPLTPSMQLPFIQLDYSSITSVLPFNLVQLPRRRNLASLAQMLSASSPKQKTYLSPRPLSSHRQSHSMSPSAVASHVLQPLDVILHLFPQLILDFHGGQLGCYCGDGSRRKSIQSSSGENVELGEDARGLKMSDAIEALERFLGLIRRRREVRRANNKPSPRLCQQRECPTGKPGIVSSSV